MNTQNTTPTRTHRERRALRRLAGLMKKRPATRQDDDNSFKAIYEENFGAADIEERPLVLLSIGLLRESIDNIRAARKIRKHAKEVFRKNASMQAAIKERVATLFEALSSTDAKRSQEAAAGLRLIARHMKKEQKVWDAAVGRFAEKLTLGHDTVRWINGTQAPATFSAVAGQLEMSPEMCRWALAKIFGWDIQPDCSAIENPFAEFFISVEGEAA
jgi:hypothetical protein